MTQGKIGWIELHATDGAAAGAFYEKAFGWKIQSDENMSDYVMFTDTSGEVGGGFTKEMPKLAGQIYILTDSIESSLKAVGVAGGKTVKEKTEITPEIGWWAQFNDPAGNVVGLYQQAQPAKK